MPILLAIQESIGDTAANSFLETVMTLGGTVTYAEMWMWLTLVLLIAEIFTAGFFIGAFAVSTVFAAAAAWLGFGRNVQLIVFSLISIASLIWVRPFFVRILSPHHVETNAPSLVGQPGTVVDSVPAGGFGRVRLSNEEWRATSDSNLSVGDAVRVLS